MKHKTNNHPTAPARKARWQSLAASALPIAACTLLLAGCMESNILPTDNRDTPIEFTATVQSATPLADRSAAPNTRTAIGSDGKTVWASGDAVGVFMLNASSAMPDGIVSQADNIQYMVNPTTGTLTPAPTPIYYPMSGEVDFIAYYPYGGNEAGGVTEDYTYEISLTDQTKPASIDLLYAKTPNRSKSNPQVSLNFSHVMSKVVFDITLGDGMDGNNPADITAMNITGMPASATLHLNAGTTTSGDAAPFDALLEANPSTNAQATFSALVPPQAEGEYAGRSIVITVGGNKFTGTIPDATAFAPNTMYTFPVTVQHKRVTVDKPAITDWTTSNNGSSTAEFLYTVTFDANKGSGTLAPQEAWETKGTVLPDGTGLTPPADGKVFAGWSTTADYSGDFYRANATFITKRNTVLYAVWSGDGSKDNPILIFDAEGLDAMRKKLDGHYSLMKDVTVSGWAPVGADAGGQSPSDPFSGTFNGQGHTVTIESIATGALNRWNQLGLFGKGDACRIRQVCVAGSIVSSNSNLHTAGGILGDAANGCVIENCLVTAEIEVSGSDLNLGGILGGAKEIEDEIVIVKNCLVRGKLTASATYGYIGGIVGYGSESQTVNCVVLSESINGVWGGTNRIGNLNSGLHNYGNQKAEGKTWISNASGNDGANCDPKPTLAWWTTLGNWKNDEVFAAWDFTKIWEMGSDGYPCLRIQR